MGRPDHERYCRKNLRGGLMPLESVFFEFLDGGSLFDTPTNLTPNTLTIRNINWRLRLTQNLSQYPPELTEMWSTFFALLCNSGEMNSDKLMAAAQKMFEIEEYLKKTPNLATNELLAYVQKSNFMQIPDDGELSAIIKSMNVKVSEAYGIPIKAMWPSITKKTYT